MKHFQSTIHFRYERNKKHFKLKTKQKIQTNKNTIWQKYQSKQEILKIEHRSSAWSFFFHFNHSFLVFSWIISIWIARTDDKIDSSCILNAWADQIVFVLFFTLISNTHLCNVSVLCLEISIIFLHLVDFSCYDFSSRQFVYFFSLISVECNQIHHATTTNRLSSCFPPIFPLSYFLSVSISFAFHS